MLPTSVDCQICLKFLVQFCFRNRVKYKGWKRTLYLWKNYTFPKKNLWSQRIEVFFINIFFELNKTCAMFYCMFPWLLVIKCRLYKHKVTKFIFLAGHLCSSLAREIFTNCWVTSSWRLKDIFEFLIISYSDCDM